MKERPDARIPAPTNKMMLGFIVRRCAAELGHAPTPDEFAEWANGRRSDGEAYCLFGKKISADMAKVMIGQPGRWVTVRPEALRQIGVRRPR